MALNARGESETHPDFMYLGESREHCGHAMIPSNQCRIGVSILRRRRSNAMDEQGEQDRMNLRRMLLALIVLLLGTLACQTTDRFIVQATVTRTRTPRPSLTPIPPATDTPVPTMTATPAPTAPPTKRPPTPRPPTPSRPTTMPPTAVPPQTAPPTVSPYEFHANAPTCGHSGLTFLKGTVYLNKNDPSQRYVGAIVALGPPDGSTIYAMEKTDGDGQYTFVLSGPGQSREGHWGLWLVTPSSQRKSDIGGPIVTNGLPPSDPKSCWAGGVDFWK